MLKEPSELTTSNEAVSNPTQPYLMQSQPLDRDRRQVHRKRASWENEGGDHSNALTVEGIPKIARELPVERREPQSRLSLTVPKSNSPCEHPTLDLSENQRSQDISVQASLCVVLDAQPFCAVLSLHGGTPILVGPFSADGL